MMNRNGCLYVNDGILVALTPTHPTYIQAYTSLEEQLKPFYPKIIRYLEPGKSFSSATVILTGNITEEQRHQLPEGLYSSRLPKMGVLKNYGFRSPETGGIYPDSALEAFKHVWFNGLTISQYNLNLLKELVDSNNIVAIALAAINPKPEGQREVRLRAYGTDKQLDVLLAELEKNQLSGRYIEVMRPTLGQEGLGNDGLHTGDASA